MKVRKKSGLDPLLTYPNDLFFLLPGLYGQGDPIGKVLQKAQFEGNIKIGGKEPLLRNDLPGCGLPMILHDFRGLHDFGENPSGNGEKWLTYTGNFQAFALERGGIDYQSDQGVWYR